MKYTKGKDKYIEIGRDQKPVYSAEDMMFFPRVWDASNDQQPCYFLQRLPWDWPKAKNPALWQ